MTAISAGDLTIMRSGSAATRYYLSVAPREPVFSATGWIWAADRMRF